MGFLHQPYMDGISTRLVSVSTQSTFYLLNVGLPKPVRALWPGVACSTSSMCSLQAKPKRRKKRASPSSAADRHILSVISPSDGPLEAWAPSIPRCGENHRYTYTGMDEHNEFLLPPR